MLRVGIVPYLVARPLTDGLALDSRVELLAAVPAKLARGLADGSLDVALASSVLSAAPPRLPFWLDGPVIASRGPIRSVLLLLRPGLRSPREVRRWITDPASRTGSALTEILLREAWDASATRIEAPAGADLLDVAEAADADAVQMIGDAALRACAERPEWRAVDLGEAWWNHLRLPFVFAGWIGRAGLEVESVAAPLADAAERGLARLPDIAAEAGRLHPLGPDFVRRYLLEDLCWRLPRAILEESLGAFASRLEV